MAKTEWKPGTAWRSARRGKVPAVDLFDGNRDPEVTEAYVAAMALTPEKKFVIETAFPDRAAEFFDGFVRQGPYVIATERAHALRNPKDGTRVMLPEDAPWPPGNITIKADKAT